MARFSPGYHFTPPEGWLNDPNGMVFLDGEYHLFYQWFDGLEVDVNYMCWAHAVSRDLVHWQHLPLAMKPDELGAIWSGSAVCDRLNTSGLFDGKGGLVAAFTHHHPGNNSERQSIAFSADNGRTWRKYAGNPVLGDETSMDFRDPRVFRHEETGKWVMLVGCRHRLFRSDDLLKWEYLGETGFSSECPDLFPLPIEGEEEERWVLSLAGSEYVIGDFDGTGFTPSSDALRVDAGPDFYAAQSWNNAPGGRRIWLAWLNNWEYAQKVPDFGARGFMSIPRDLSLRRTSSGKLALVQQPVPELEALRKETVCFEPGQVVHDKVLFRSHALEIEAVMSPAEDDACGFSVLSSGAEETLVGFDAGGGCGFLDRERSGNPVTSGRFQTPLEMKGGEIRLRIFADRTSVEVFFNEGEAVFSALVYPGEEADGVRWFSKKGASVLRELKIHCL